MHHVRLTGLILFITTIFLGLAAAATQTWTIKIKRPSWASGSSTTDAGRISDVPDNTDEYASAAATQGPPTDARDADSPRTDGLQFMDVPVFQPLIFFGILGLILWFVPAGVTSGLTPAKKRRRRNRRKR